MLRLSCSFQNYDWGKVGKDSEVFSLLSEGSDGLVLSDNLPFAELWMGTHPSGPSHICGSKKALLGTYLIENPNSLGISKARFGKKLPFLFKVLSVRKALSIQAHPDKNLAEKLHHDRPDIYKDANHKPEIAIALTSFEALLAFRPVTEIAAFISGIPELLTIVGPEHAADLCAVANNSDRDDTVYITIKAAYEMLMRADPNLVSDNVNQLYKSLESGNELTVRLPDSSSVDLKVLKEVFIRLANEYPGDCGCFSLFFFNYVRLEPGQAVFLEANQPHAYISGDCVECMACSDNVVRAGLTPKYKDVECLLSMLQYEPRSPSSLIFKPKMRTIRTDLATPTVPVPTVLSYAPPVEEFAVDRITIPLECKSFQLFSLTSASILIVISGSGKFQLLQNDDATSGSLTNGVRESYAGALNQVIDFHRGMVFFINADVAFCVHPDESSTTNHKPILIFRAYANVDNTSVTES